MSGSLDPQASYVPAGLRKAVKEALDQGWTAKKSGSGGWFIRSPKGTQKFYIPITAKDPDALATVLRSKINKAYLREPTSFERRAGGGTAPQETIDRMTAAGDVVIHMTGAGIRQGPAGVLTCPDCDGEWVEIDGFIGHQDECRERVRAALTAEQAQEVPEEGDDVVEPSEGRTEDVPEQTQSGTIAHEEETLTDTQEVQKPKQKRGSWTLTTNDPLHRALYIALREAPRRTNETDSKWARRLADCFIEQDLLAEVLPEFEPTDEVSASRVLAQIRTMLGADETEALKVQVDELKTANESLRTTLRTFSELAREATQ